MAVYTHLGAEALAELISAYDVGELVSAKGIAEGISNSNWMIETLRSDGTSARFILTLYERRIEAGDLPFFLALLDHLAACGCAVPATIHDRTGASLREVAGRAAALIQFLPGVSPSRPTAAQAQAVGAALARVHLAGRDFALARKDGLDPPANHAVLDRIGLERLSSIDPRLAPTIAWAEEIVAHWPHDLPVSIIHSDLFPDNVLMRGDEVTGLIDFYFACNGMMAYDLAVTHAAWAFGEAGERFEPTIGAALVTGYESVRPLERVERQGLALLAQGACLRFTASRAEDWLEAPAGVQVIRKDPLDFLRRWQFYRQHGPALFAKP